MAPTIRPKNAGVKAKASATSSSRKPQAVIISPKTARKKAIVRRAPKRNPPRVIDDEDNDEEPAEDEFVDESMLEPLPPRNVGYQEADTDEFEIDDDDEDDELDDLEDQPQAATRRIRRAVSPKFSLSVTTPISHRPNRSPAATPSHPRTPLNVLQRDALQYTPYQNRVNPRDPSKPLLTHQSPQSQSILRRAAHKYRAETVTRRPFMDEDTRIRTATTVFHDSARELEADRRILRFEGDAQYQESMLKLVKRSDSQVRGEVVFAAREIVGASYRLGPGHGNVLENRRLVTYLLSDKNFVFSILETGEHEDGSIHTIRRVGPYRNVIFATIIQQEFFNNHEQMAVADLTSDCFNPIPIALIAFVATAVQCALQDWSTGIRIKSSIDFTVEEWSDVFDEHVMALEKMRDANKKGFTAWLGKLYDNCWSTTRQSLASAPGMDPSFTAEEMDNYDDVEGLEQYEN